MVRSLWTMVGLAILAIPTLLRAEGTYTIKSSEAAEGDQTLVERHETDKTRYQTLDPQGIQIKEDEKTTTKVFSFRETILEKPKGEKKATRLKRQYTKAKVGQDNHIEPLPYEGETLLIEKRGSVYHFQIEGGEELTGKDAQDLETEFNKKDTQIDFNKIMLPKKPLRVNESWELDAKPLAEYFQKKESTEIDSAHAVAKGKLVRAYRKDNHQFGVIEIHLKFPVRTVQLPGLKVPLQEGSRMIMELKADGCIDGSINTAILTGNTTVKLAAELPGPKGEKNKIIVNATQTMLESDTPLPRK